MDKILSMDFIYVTNCKVSECMKVSQIADIGAHENDHTPPNENKVLCLGDI